jgi:hypothetical protein
MRLLLSLADPPDAVFCCNDLLALGALRTLLAAGLRVPEDVAGVDIEDGRFSTPTLTTIAQDKTQIAEAAVTMLLERVNGLDAPTREIAAHHTLQVRRARRPALHRPGPVGRRSPGPESAPGPEPAPGPEFARHGARTRPDVTTRPPT